MRSGEHLKKWQAPSAADALCHPPEPAPCHVAAVEASFRQEMLMTQEAWERNCCSIPAYHSKTCSMITLCFTSNCFKNLLNLYWEFYATKQADFCKPGF